MIRVRAAPLAAAPVLPRYVSVRRVVLVVQGLQVVPEVLLDVAVVGLLPGGEEADRLDGVEPWVVLVDRSLDGRQLDLQVHRGNDSERFREVKAETLRTPIERRI